MDEYSQFIPSQPGAEEGSSHNYPSDGIPQSQIPTMPMASSGAPMTSSYQNLGYYTGFPDPIMFQAPKPPSSRGRKKSTPGLEHVKHRRTRSGCYTCRNRRVKCDETHPICDRCRKGKRECTYPEQTSGKGQSSSREGSGQGDSPGTASDEVEDEGEKDARLDTIADEEEPGDSGLRPQQSYSSLRRRSTASTLNLQRSGTRHSSETPSLEGTKSASPSVSTGTSVSFTTPSLPQDPSIPAGPSDWSHLPPDLQFYLQYFCDNMTHYSYCVVFDTDAFFMKFLPSVAVQSGNESLLYALVGFAAYHRTIQNPSGNISEFLQYYNKSVTLLLEAFKKGGKQNTATLLTILQLATIEEYLGDWVNLSGHQKAALQIVTQLYTPQSAMQSFISRTILTWYVRFDVFVGMLGGYETRLPREWFSATVEFHESQRQADPEGVLWKQEAASALLRLISVDMSFLYAKAKRGEVSGEAFASEYNSLTAQLHTWRNNLDPGMVDSTYLETDFKWRRPLEEDDIVDPYAPGHLYSGDLFPTTLLLAEWHSVVVMHKSQEPGMLQQEPTQELVDLSMAICQIFDNVEKWPPRPSGTLAMLQACLVIAAIFVPRDVKHHMWMRRKFALIEKSGYLAPFTIRSRMALIFRDPSCIRWWIPNDDGFTPILQETRAFADERNGVPVSKQSEDVRDMASVFAKMRLDYEGEQSPTVTPSSGPSS
ncbi:Sterol uptake control protein 2 [Apiospora arundinis]|uniref:Sterol uptake control protein 2 n=1 Tax=Apiospora arundinis TaxID=335852 RepID=A0ABR2ITG1_9PEZI